MPFPMNQCHLDEYQRNGFTILRGIVPGSLIKDLRAAAVDFRESAAADSRLGETAKWQLQPIGKHISNLRAFQDYAELAPLAEALARILTPQHTHANIQSTAGLFFEPPHEPASTGWHRDWTGEFPGIPLDEWQAMRADVRYFAQGNCPLYEDCATWLIAGSHLQLNDPDVLEAVRFKVDWKSLEPVERERMFIEHARSLPGAVQAVLEPGDYLLYRNTTWHTGIYMPYRRRATIFDFVEHPDYARWRARTDKQWHVGRDMNAAEKKNSQVLQEAAVCT
jgi:ectoine hydroxylase-related dioxygenase (phytanoyl-CoA dioxygenase family)